MLQRHPRKKLKKKKKKKKQGFAMATN